MDPLTVGLMSGASSLIGSIFSSNTSAQNTQAQIAAQQQMQQQTEQFNAGQVQQQEAYQTQMSNTAYQRATQDMEKAGLNPMMMFGSGGAASSPAGASASVGTPSVPMPSKTSPLAGLGTSVSNAINSALTAKTFDKMTDEMANLFQTNKLLSAQTRTESQRPELQGTSASDVLKMPAWLRSSLNIGSFAGSKADDAISPIVNSAGAVRRFLPTRSTSQKSSVDSSGKSTDTFEDRWDNLMGAYQR